MQRVSYPSKPASHVLAPTAIPGTLGPSILPDEALPLAPEALQSEGEPASAQARSQSIARKGRKKSDKRVSIGSTAIARDEATAAAPPAVLPELPAPVLGQLQPPGGGVAGPQLPFPSTPDAILPRGGASGVTSRPEGAKAGTKQANRARVAASFAEVPASGGGAQGADADVAKARKSKSGSAGRQRGKGAVVDMRADGAVSSLLAGNAEVSLMAGTGEVSVLAGATQGHGGEVLGAPAGKKAASVPARVPRGGGPAGAGIQKRPRARGRKAQKPADSGAVLPDSTVQAVQVDAPERDTGGASPVTTALAVAVTKKAPRSRKRKAGAAEVPADAPADAIGAVQSAVQLAACTVQKEEGGVDIGTGAGAQKGRGKGRSRTAAVKVAIDAEGAAAVLAPAEVGKKAISRREKKAKAASAAEGGEAEEGIEEVVKPKRVRVQRATYGEPSTLIDLFIPHPFKPLPPASANSI